MKRKQKKRKLKSLKDWMKRKREENLSMTPDEFNAKLKRHELERKIRENKRQKIKHNKRRRFLMWKRRYRKKLKGLGDHNDK